VLTTYQQNVLTAECAKADYNGMTATQGWAWLTQPMTQTSTTVPTGVMLTPDVVADALDGPGKAEAIAVAMFKEFPTTGNYFLSKGVDPLNSEVQAFLASLAAITPTPPITSADVATLIALGTMSQTTIVPPRFDQRFDPNNWPANIDGTTGQAVPASITTYCQRCGINNPDSATVCSNCSLPFTSAGPFLLNLPGAWKPRGAAMGLHGFPNSIAQADYNAAWAAAGRS